MKIKIATDSTSDIPENFREQLHISVLPMTFTYEGKEYRDGIDITTSQMYEILETAKKLPESSQVALSQYAQLFEDTWKQGYSDLIHVTVNSKGSGTYQAGVLARQMFYEEHPEAKDSFAIHVIDSGTYSMAYGIAVIEAAQLAESGASVEAVLSHLEDWLTHARPMFVPLDLKCVKKSGRVSAAAAFVGDAIGLKPMITFENGESTIISKVRGDAKAVFALVERCMQERKPGTNYALVYGNNDEAYQKLKEACAQVMDQPPIAEYPVGCVIAINAGPNMIGILYRT